MRTVFWEDNKVKMIDQRLLPAEFVIVAYDTVAGVAEGIRDMAVRGAPAIGATGAYGMALAAYALSLIHISYTTESCVDVASSYCDTWSIV